MKKEIVMERSCANLDLSLINIQYVCVCVRVCVCVCVHALGVMGI